MPIESISIHRFRNIRTADLRFSPALNVVTGANGAGKSSLLEALYVLARARSFRTAHLDALIENGQDNFLLVAKLARDQSRSLSVGLQRVPGHFECRIDGQPSKRLSDLAALFPIQWVGGNLHTLVEAGPSHRRQFLDWGLFHVKPEYILSWKRFNKLLKQRNAALRAGVVRREVEAWNKDLAEAGEAIHAYRKTYVHQLIQSFDEIRPMFPALGGDLAIEYRKGWRAGKDYLNTLWATYETDRTSQFTRTGPQRAELLFRVNGRPAGEVLSRGQQKVFITALQVAQASQLQRETGSVSLFLFDDLGAELDTENQRIVLKLLGEMDAQVFVSLIESSPVLDQLSATARTFHVEHGEVSEVV